MNPRSLISVLIVLFISTHQIKAQDSLKTRFSRHSLLIGVGWSFAANKKLIDTYEQHADGSSTSYEYKYGLGQGLYGFLGYQFMFNKELGIEGRVEKLFGTPAHSENIIYNQTKEYAVKQYNDMTGQLWKFELLGVFRTNYRKVSPYLKAGIVIGKATATRSITENVTFMNTGEKQKGEIEVKNTGGTSVGISTTAGIDISTKSKNCYFIEVSYTSLNHMFTHWEETEHKINGQDKLSTLPPDQKSGTYSSPQPTGSDLFPWQTPFSSLSLSVGYRIAL